MIGLAARGPSGRIIVQGRRVGTLPPLKRQAATGVPRFPQNLAQGSGHAITKEGVALQRALTHSICRAGRRWC